MYGQTQHNIESNYPPIKKEKNLELYICTFTFSAIAINYVIKKLAICYKIKQNSYAILLLFLKTFWLDIKEVLPSISSLLNVRKKEGIFFFKGH